MGVTWESDMSPMGRMTPMPSRSVNGALSRVGPSASHWMNPNGVSWPREPAVSATGSGCVLSVCTGSGCKPVVSSACSSGGVGVASATTDVVVRGAGVAMAAMAVGVGVGAAGGGPESGVGVAEGAGDAPSSTADADVQAASTSTKATMTGARPKVRMLLLCPPGARATSGLAPKWFGTFARGLTPAPGWLPHQR